MKRMKSLGALLALSLMLTGCSTPSTSTPSGSASTNAIAAGTYTGTGEGNNGPISVDVTFEADGRISVVEVTQHEETPNIADSAIEQIPSEIVEYQSIAVDTVSGATNTSNGILAAVADAISQAGGDPASYEVAVETNEEPVGDRTTTVDVLVIGGGGTGLAAAMSALDNGAESVMLVEKMAHVGGSTAVSGAVVAAEGTYYTDQAGIPVDHDAWLESWRQSSIADIGVIGVDPGYPNYDRVTHYFDQVGQAVNWLEDKGVAHWVEYPMFPGGTYQVPDYIVSDAGADPEGGYMLTDHMVEWLQSNGADVRLETAGTKLLTNENGDVIGAAVEDDQGSYDVYTNKGVVLATGGFAASEAMMEAYLPQFADWIDLTTSGAGSTGDGMKMAVEVGGVMYDTPYVITLGSTSRDPSLSSFCMSVNLWQRIVVNSDGQRFFSEGGMPYQATVALSETKDGVAWALGDGHFANGDLLEAAVDGKEVVKADTIEELAELMGVDPTILVETVDTYNQYCANGVDEEFGKEASNLVPLDQGPYYAVRIYVCTGGTIGGVKTNLDYQVIREDGSVINGLYAGGETSNREMYAYAYSSGSGVGYALASGHQIGINIMK